MDNQDRFLTGLTPIERHGDLWLKRDDLFMVGGAQGGKARTCWKLARGATGLVTAGSRASPQVNIVARVAAKLGVPCSCHTPSGQLSFPLLEARDQFGAKVTQYKAGYNSVIIARAHADAVKTGWKEIPFGMECREAVEQTALQYKEIPKDVCRIVVPVGSGMSLAGVVHGMLRTNRTIPIVGVVVGASPLGRLNRWLPFNFKRIRLLNSEFNYDQSYPKPLFRDVVLDPIYEAKCIPFLEPGDLLWVVGIRPGVKV